MKKYMKWNLTMLVGLLIFWAAAVGLQINTYMLYEFISYPYDVWAVIDKLVGYVCIAGAFTVAGSLLTLPALTLYDALRALDKKRIKVRETKRKKWLM